MFRLISLTIHKHPILAGKTFDLVNTEESINENEETENKQQEAPNNYYSIIIGANGTGKSNLIGFIIEVFNELVLLKTVSEYSPKKRYTLKYQIHNDKFDVISKSQQILILKNDLKINISDIILPLNWIASSVTINDKYPILNSIRKKQIPQYQYLGIRSATNNAFISRIKINTVFHFVDSVRKKKADSLLKVYNGLSLKPDVKIIFNGGPMLKFEKRDGKYVIPKSQEKIIEAHIAFIKNNKSRVSYRVDNYKKHTDNHSEILMIFQFIKTNAGLFEKSTKAGIQLNYPVNLDSKVGIEKLLNDWSTLSIMLDLELIKINKFLVFKESAFKFEEASSGESHLLGSLHGIISNLKDNSLVIIDEPEVSLHPNWQIDYLEILKPLINSHSGVNVIISTHSHFLISSLKNYESRITSLRRDEKSKSIKIEELDYETYGWEPERILYKIFGLVTQRNNYFESDLRALIKLISSEESDLNEVKRLYEILKYYILSDKDDPLKVIISRTENYIHKRDA